MKEITKQVVEEAMICILTRITERRRPFSPSIYLGNGIKLWLENHILWGWSLREEYGQYLIGHYASSIDEIMNILDSIEAERSTREGTSR